jgi:hypothetical protein
MPASMDGLVNGGAQIMRRIVIVTTAYTPGLPAPHSGLLREESHQFTANYPPMVEISHKLNRAIQELITVLAG